MTKFVTSISLKKLNVLTIALVIVILTPLTLFSQDSIKVPVKVFDYMAEEGIKSNMYYQDNVNLSAINLGLKGQINLQQSTIKEYKSQILELGNKEDLYLDRIQSLEGVVVKQQNKITQNKVLLWVISSVSVATIVFVAAR